MDIPIQGQTVSAIMVVAIGWFGGMARYFHQFSCAEQQDLSYALLIGNAVVSGFLTVIIGFALAYCQTDAMLLYALCGIVALSSHEIIGLAPRIVKRFSKQTPDLPVVSNTSPAQDERSYSHVHSYLTHVLTERELSISIALAQGKTTHQIAQHYHISDSTVRTHKQRVLNKLRANSDDQLIRLVHDSGLLEPSDSDIS